MELTLKEFDLIELLMRNPGKVYSREQLLDLVWGYDYQGDIRTVDVHIRRLREKLERNPAALDDRCLIAELFCHLKYMSGKENCSSLIAQLPHHSL